MPDVQRGRSSTPRRTAYAVAIEARAQGIQEALGVYAYDAALDRIAQIRRYADILEREIEAERAANWPPLWRIIPGYLRQHFHRDGRS